MDNRRSGSPAHSDRLIYWACVLLAGMLTYVASGLQYLAQQATIAARNLIRIASRHR
jgi:hypothetical protein